MRFEILKTIMQSAELIHPILQPCHTKEFPAAVKSQRPYTGDMKTDTNHATHTRRHTAATGE